jgi:hypothetical protein
MNNRWRNHALQRRVSTRPKPSRRGCNGFARVRSLSPAGLRLNAEFLSPYPKRLKCGVPRVGSPATAELGR